MRVLLDMDGVLVDVSGSFRRAVIETSHELAGVTVTPADVQAYKNRGGFNNDWVLTHAIVTEAGVDVPYDEVVQAFNRRYRGNAWDGFIAHEPALASTETLETLSLRGPLALVTGRQREEALFTLNRFGWIGLFPVVVAMEDQDGREKPDPFPLELALARLSENGEQVHASNAVYVGDTVDDVRAALSAGLRCVGVVPPYLDATRHEQVLRSAGADVVVHDMQLLPREIDRLATS